MAEDSQVLQFEVRVDRRRYAGAKWRVFLDRLRSGFHLGYLQRQRKLGPLEEIPKMFDILLTTIGHQTRFRFRQDNFYPVGYQMEGGKWLEFSGHPQQLITGSEPLGFGGGYQNLTLAGGIGLGDVRVGLEDLASAVDKLATTTNQQQRACSLLVLTMMISEAIRYTDFEDFVTGFYENGSLLPSDLQEQLDCGSSSTSVSKQPSVVKILDPNFRGGQPLLEVFSVCINHTKEEFKIWGTITADTELLVTDLEDKVWIYNREENDPEPVGQGESCTLIGPAPRCVEAHDNFTIDLDLKSFEGHKVAHGWIDWSDCNTGNNIYNKLLSHKFCGDNGVSATVNYKVFRQAVQADVAVVLMKSNGASHVSLFGVVKASNYDYPNHERILFKRRWVDSPLKVQVEQEITLSRSVVAVPIKTSLVVRATLDVWKPREQIVPKRPRHEDSYGFSPRPEIANGTAVFEAKPSGVEEKFIAGRYSEIQVRVVWSDDWE